MLYNLSYLLIIASQVGWIQQPADPGDGGHLVASGFPGPSRESQGASQVWWIWLRAGPGVSQVGWIWQLADPRDKCHLFVFVGVESSGWVTLLLCPWSILQASSLPESLFLIPPKRRRACMVLYLLLSVCLPGMAALCKYLNLLTQQSANTSQNEWLPSRAIKGKALVWKWIFLSVKWTKDD